MTAQSQTLNGPLFVDAHVHVHTCYPAENLLDAVKNSLCAYAVGRANKSQILGCLLFAERAEENFFTALLEGASNVEVGAWRLRKTSEDTSVLAYFDDRPTLLMVAGRQIATRDGLEVLALMCRQRIRDGLPLKETVEASNAAGAITVIPWGFGKWWFRRGRLLREFLNSAEGASVLLGDNGGRPALFPASPLFTTPSRARFPVLPGSDPLPFRDEVSRVGSYGFLLEGNLDLRTPAADLKRLIEDLDHQPPLIGRSVGFSKFVMNQCRLWLR